MTVCAKFDCRNAVPPKVSGRGPRPQPEILFRPLPVAGTGYAQQRETLAMGNHRLPVVRRGLSTREPARIYCSGRCQKRAYYWNHTRKQPKEWWE